MYTTLDEQSFIRPINILAMADDADRVRKAFAKYLEIHKLSGREVSTLGGLSPSAASQFINGNSRSPKRDTLEKFAAGASKKLERTVTVAEMLDQKSTVVEIPIRSYVGAGDEIMPFDTDEPVDYTAAPPGMDDAEATEVRGRSMTPLYHDRDILFHRRVETDPSRFRDEVVVCQVKDGKRFVKLLTPGSRKGRYNLVSVNPAFATIEDQVIVWVGPIEWVRKRSLRGK